MGAADAALEHAAVPHRNVVLCRQIVQRNRLRVAADASRLDVDDPAGAELDRLGRSANRVERLVEADRRPQPRLQAGVVADVVVVERLFDHHQIELVERRK